MKVLGMGNALVDMVIELRDDSLLDEFDLRKGSMQLVDLKLSNQILEKTKNFKTSEV